MASNVPLSRTQVKDSSSNWLMSVTSIFRNFNSGRRFWWSAVICLITTVNNTSCSFQAHPTWSKKETSTFTEINIGDGFVSDIEKISAQSRVATAYHQHLVLGFDVPTDGKLGIIFLRLTPFRLDLLVQNAAKLGVLAIPLKALGTSPVKELIPIVFLTKLVMISWQKTHDDQGITFSSSCTVLGNFSSTWFAICCYDVVAVPLLLIPCQTCHSFTVKTPETWNLSL